MSGGAFDYFYSRLNEVAEEIYQERTEEEKTLARLLKDLSEVMYALEWWRSGDTDRNDFVKVWQDFKENWLKEVK